MRSSVVFRVFACVAIVAALSLSAGCGASPLSRREIAGEPALAAIDERFRAAVAEIEDEPGVSWHSGWFGNWVVNTIPGNRRGLCYHWQEEVFRRVEPTIREVGWDAVGIKINEETPGEHHAILVYDPARTSWLMVLSADAPRHGYVLDAWRRAEPDIYTLEDWLTLPWRHRKDAEVEVLASDGLPIDESLALRVAEEAERLAMERSAERTQGDGSESEKARDGAE